MLNELKKRRKGRFKIDQKGNDFWVIVNSGDILVNLFTEEGRQEYDLERIWVLRRDERNVFSSDFDEAAETRWIYDEEDGMFDEEDPVVAKYKGWDDDSSKKGKKKKNTGSDHNPTTEISKTSLKKGSKPKNKGDKKTKVAVDRGKRE
eukprot:TRINITY_DN5709_c0_g1_i1.p1 TRINITY_DN5709_c0_g1~~TRINITY_DN5709_c0_g1_i1.p1  ORF type:complete len:148 (-),score=43.86 TRINITY_DN5709_c0_g1_i1:15-458(-)